MIFRFILDNIFIFLIFRNTGKHLCGIVNPGETSLNIPLPLLYTTSGDLYIRPANNLYEMSDESISWHNFYKNPRPTVRCTLSSDSLKAIYFNLVVEADDALSETGSRVVDQIYTVHIYPPLLFKNLLPVVIEVERPVKKVLHGGDHIELNATKGQKIKYSIDYNNDKYIAEMSIKSGDEDLDIVTLRSATDSTKRMNLGIHWSTRQRQQECSIYAPYWMVNNTGKVLSYFVDSATKHGLDRNIILLPLAGSSFNKKIKAKLRVKNSNWSDEFPIYVAGRLFLITVITYPRF